MAQGFSAACGLAYARQLDAKPGYVYAIIGDGESQEGQVWEAAMFAAHYRLDHLIAFTDYNKMQIDGTTGEMWASATSRGSGGASAGIPNGGRPRCGGLDRAVLAAQKIQASPP